MKCYILKQIDSDGGVTCELLSCAVCGGVIDGMGGPGNGEICERCADLITSKKLREMIDWRKHPTHG